MRLRDAVVERCLRLTAFSSVLALLAITLFIFKEGVPFIYRVGLGNFLSTSWHPTQSAHHYGIAYMIVGSAVVTAGALSFGVPLGVACAVVLGEMSSEATRSLFKPAIEILAGIPSVVFGLSLLGSGVLSSSCSGRGSFAFGSAEHARMEAESADAPMAKSEARRAKRMA